MTETVGLRVAVSRDIGAVLPLQRAYYADDGYPFVEEVARATLEKLAADPALGQLWVIESGGEIIGYFAITFGYSLEYRGRDAFLDEIYVAPAWQRLGIGQRVLKTVDESCRAAGVQALHLEAERRRSHLYDFYRAAGFEDQDRHLMTKRLRQE